MTEKKGFILYHDASLIFQELTDEQAGQLIKYIVNYSISKTQPNPTEPSGLSGLLNAISKQFINHIDWDFQRWEKTCEKNRNNGKNGGRNKKNKPTGGEVNPIIDNRDKIIDIKIEDIEKKKYKKETRKLLLQDWETVNGVLDMEKLNSWITNLSLDHLKISAELEVFKLKCKAKGYQYIDFVSAFQSWVNNKTYGNGIAKFKTTNRETA